MILYERKKLQILENKPKLGRKKVNMMEERADQNEFAVDKEDSLFDDVNEKAEMFDMIASFFYKSNFGLASKAEIELLMFHFLMEKMIKDHSKDGLLDYNACSDYKLSKILGITQQRVRNLKVKKQLIYPVEFDWKESLGQLVKNATYDENTRMITINIPDPNLFYEIQNYIEEQGGFVDVQINRKVLKIRAEYYLMLCVEMEGEDQKEIIIRQINENLKKHLKENKLVNDNTLGKQLSNILKMGVNITEILANNRYLFRGKALDCGTKFSC